MSREELISVGKYSTIYAYLSFEPPHLPPPPPKRRRLFDRFALGP